MLARYARLASDFFRGRRTCWELAGPSWELWVDSPTCPGGHLFRHMIDSFWLPACAAGETFDAKCALCGGRYDVEIGCFGSVKSCRPVGWIEGTSRNGK